MVNLHQRLSEESKGLSWVTEVFPGLMVAKGSNGGRGAKQQLIYTRWIAWNIGENKNFVIFCHET